MKAGIERLTHIDYHSVSKAFRHRGVWEDGVPLSIAGRGFNIYYLPFSSANAHHLLGEAVYRCEEHGVEFAGEAAGGEAADSRIRENIEFKYPLLREAAAGGHVQRRDRVTVLLHGLNERSFTKYLPWAYQLMRRTAAPVLLFPLTFHVNRVSPLWARQQQEIYGRRSGDPANDGATRFNSVISDRLESRPERFFWGTVQSYLDLTDLVKTIRAGRHPHFTPDAQVDLLGYSAGGYLSLLLLLADEEGLFADSRAVVFGSSVAMRDLNLLSPLILDSASEDAMMRAYVKNIERFADPRMLHWFEAHGVGRWFRAFSGVRPDTAAVEKRIAEVAPRVLGICNVNDMVMPLGAALNTLQGVRRDTGVPVIELELGAHESPFVCPSIDDSLRRAITEFIDVEAYGGQFEKFILGIDRHFGG